MQCDKPEAKRDQGDDRKAIESAIDEFVGAYNAGDIIGVLSYYADDLVKIRNGAPAEMKECVARRPEAVFAGFETRVDVLNDAVGVSGEVAFTRGRFRVTLRPKKGGDPNVIERRYLEIWKKERGRWLVMRTMDNTE